MPKSKPKAKSKAKTYVEPKLEGYTKEELISTFQYFRAFRAKKEAIWKLVRAFHAGDFWKDLAEKLPDHQIMPDTNYLEYIEKGIVNSVYSGNYSANCLPRDYKDNDFALGLNSFINYRWDKLKMKSMYPKLGKNAILYNYAGIQMGWNADLIGGSLTKREQGAVESKFLPPEQIYLDPSITDYLAGRAIFLSKKVSLFDLLSEPALNKGAKAYKEKLSTNGKFNPQPNENADAGDIHGEADPINEYSRSVHLIEAFFKVEGDGGKWRIDHVFIADKDFILHVKKDIKPKTFPIRILYENEPDSDPYGISTSRKILANIVAINMIDSIEATHLYATQNRTKLVNVKSGINYRSFAKFGNTPHIAFPVNGDPKNVVQYVDVQQLPNPGPLVERLEAKITIMTGVDARYTGRDTGSVQTTGGMDLQQQRVMSMTDNLRIVGLENFVESLTELFIDYYIQYGGVYNEVKRQKATGLAIEHDEGKGEIDFGKIERNEFDYTMNAAPYLPKNSVRLSDAADQLLLMQGQYQFEPAIITHEEWLMWKDFPQKELILQRIRGAMQQLDTEELTADLLSFAGMVDKGMQPEDAINTLVQEKQMKRDNPGLANQGSAAANGQGPVQL